MSAITPTVENGTLKLTFDLLSKDAYGWLATLLLFPCVPRFNGMVAIVGLVGDEVLVVEVVLYLLEKLFLFKFIS